MREDASLSDSFLVNHPETFPSGRGLFHRKRHRFHGSLGTGRSLRYNKYCSLWDVNTSRRQFWHPIPEPFFRYSLGNVLQWGTTYGSIFRNLYFSGSYHI